MHFIFQLTGEELTTWGMWYLTDMSRSETCMVGLMGLRCLWNSQHAHLESTGRVKPLVM